MNQKILIFFSGIFVFFLINLTSALQINYTSSDTEGIQITMLKYEDYPTNPGEYFDVWIQATLGSNINYAKFQFVEEYPFSADGDSSYEFTDYHGEVVMHFKMRVDENAVEGNNELKFKVFTSRVGDSYMYRTFDIYVADAQTDFDMIVQDSSDSDFSVAIANVGKNTANSLIVRIPSQDGYTVSGTNGQMVGNLDSGDYTIVSFSLVPNGKSDSLQVQLDYTDAIGERRSVIKEISYSGYISSPSGNFSGMSQLDKSSGTSIFKTYWFWGAVVLVLIVGFYFYRRNSKLKSQGKDSPDWVISERKKR